MEFNEDGTQRDPYEVAQAAYKKEAMYLGMHEDSNKIMLRLCKNIINNKNVSMFGSQGQQRTIAIAIKLAYAEILKRLNKECVVILDDVYGELDPERQKNIIKMLDLNNQILITTTTLSCIEKDIIDKSNIIKIYKTC